MKPDKPPGPEARTSHPGAGSDTRERDRLPPVSRHRVRRTLAGAFFASLLTASVAAATAGNSIRIVLPNHIGAGAVKMSVDGHASAAGRAVWLESQPGSCSANYNVESHHKNLTTWISGQAVHAGNFQVKYLPHIVGASVKGVHFCAYLTTFTSSDKFVTQAYESLHVPK
jgi:hypothetical protein